MITRAVIRGHLTWGRVYYAVIIIIIEYAPPKHVSENAKEWCKTRDRDKINENF